MLRFWPKQVGFFDKLYRKFSTICFLCTAFLQSDMTVINYKQRRTDKLIEEKVPGSGMLLWFYGTILGKATLNLLIKRKLVSSVGGWFMNSTLSQSRIQPFIDKYKIDLSEYQVNESSSFKTFNDFFYRKINPEKRPIGDGLVSPADGKLLAFQTIKEAGDFFVKGSSFNLNTFLQDRDLARKYDGGAMIIVRLAPTDYHRFHFPVDGVVSKTELINGNYFSVSPLALKKSLEIFCQNKRTYCIQSSDEFGDVLISDVGATMVGSIVQTYEPNKEYSKGDEKGYFEFGGSTLVVLIEKDKVKLSSDLIANSKMGFETEVKMGETIGLAI